MSLKTAPEEKIRHPNSAKNTHSHLQRKTRRQTRERRARRGEERERERERRRRQRMRRKRQDGDDNGRRNTARHVTGRYTIGFWLLPHYKKPHGWMNTYILHHPHF
jgi:hypothetical protein